MPKGIAHYRLVYDMLKAKIDKGEYKAGDKLPTEPELALQYNVNRGVLRNALKMLEDEGRISRQPGRGTFVQARPDKTPEIRSLTDQISDAKMQPSTVLVDERKTTGLITAGEAPPFVAEAYNLDRHSQERALIRVDRLRLGDGKLLARQTVYLLVAQFGADFLNRHKPTKSLFEIYEAYGRHVVRVEEKIHARIASPQEADVRPLRLPEEPPEARLVYVRERVSYDELGNVLEVLHSVDRASFFRAYTYSLEKARSRIEFGEAALPGDEKTPNSSHRESESAA